MGALTSSIEKIVASVGSIEGNVLNRAVGAAIAAPSGAVLGIATWLTPSPSGYGTHLQLGLKECTVMHYTGWPCPMCGMTTTFTLMAHIRPLDALLTQPFGVMLFGLTFLGAGIGLYDLLTGAGAWRRMLRWVAPRERRIAAALMLGLLVGWLYKAVRLHPEFFGIGG